MLFSDWHTLGRTLAMGVLCYIALLSFLRVFGKRSMSTWNAFDWIVTVAMGSTLATCLLSKDVTFAEGALAFAVLLTLQLVVTWSCVRSPTVSRLVKAEPALLVRDGELLRDAMRRERVTESEILAGLRACGVSKVQDVAAVVLETNGQFSVLQNDAAGTISTLQGVRGAR